MVHTGAADGPRGQKMDFGENRPNSGKMGYKTLRSLWDLPMALKKVWGLSAGPDVSWAHRQILAIGQNEGSDTAAGAKRSKNYIFQNLKTLINRGHQGLSNGPSHDGIRGVLHGFLDAGS